MELFLLFNRTQAIKVQETLKTIYTGVKGEYYFGNKAWDFVRNVTGVILLDILKDIAKKHKGT